MTVPAREKKRAPVAGNLEPSIYRIVQDLCARMDITVSGYIRRLIIEDLRTKGLLPDKLLAKLFLNTQ